MHYCCKKWVTCHWCQYPTAKDNCTLPCGAFHCASLCHTWPKMELLPILDYLSMTVCDSENVLDKVGSPTSKMNCLETRIVHSKRHNCLLGRTFMRTSSVLSLQSLANSCHHTQLTQREETLLLFINTMNEVAYSSQCIHIYIFWIILEIPQFSG